MRTRSRLASRALFVLPTVTIIFLLTANSCRRQHNPLVSSELILFSTEGNTPFSDFVWTINSDGSNPERLLSPNRDRSYVAASGNALDKGIVVSVHRSEADEFLNDKLFLFWPNKGEWHELITEDLLQGNGVLAPDNIHVAFVAAPRSDTANFRIWITDIQSGVTRRLSDDEKGTTDASPGWHPDSNQLSFLRVERTPLGLVTKLMIASLNGTNSSEILLNKDHAVLSFCYAPDGKRIALWTKRGLEVLSIRDLSSQIILPIEQLTASFRLPSDNLGCSTRQDRLVYALNNTRTMEAELWTIGTDGSNPTKIYSAPNTTMRHPTFLRK